MYGQNHQGHHGHHPCFGYHRRRGSLRTWVFSILHQAPKNGAEIINQIEAASQGNWRPSPGSIYPLLDELCKEGSVTKREDGRYEITERGKQEFEWPYKTVARQHRSTENIVEVMNSYLSYLEDLKRMDPTKIAPNMDKLKTLRDRLTTIIDTP